MIQMDANVIAILAVLGGAAFVRSAIGFGDALVAMGLLTPWIGVQTATPLVGLVGMVIASLVLAAQWQQLNLKSTLPLILSTLFGIPFGLILLKLVPDSVAQAVLGALLIGYGAHGLSKLELPMITTDRFAGVFGFIAGVLGSAYNASGVVIVVYGTLRRWQPEQFRLILQGYFFFTGWLFLAGHALAGLWTTQVWSLFLLSLPVVTVSVWLGGIANRHIKPDFFAKLVFGALLGIGLLCLSQSLHLLSRPA